MVMLMINAWSELVHGLPGGKSIPTPATLAVKMLVSHSGMGPLVNGKTDPWAVP